MCGCRCGIARLVEAARRVDHVPARLRVSQRGQTGLRPHPRSVLRPAEGQMTPPQQIGSSRWQRLTVWAWPGHPVRWSDVPARLRPTLVTVGRLTAAAVVSYLISLVLTEGAIDLTGPLTALLV